MASGYYPLDRRDGAGKLLHKLGADLKRILDSEGNDRYANVPNCLPSPSDENTPEDAAMDGGYRERLRLAHEFIEGVLQTAIHDSDCALHNMPAYPNGPCDCSLSK